MRTSSAPREREQSVLGLTEDAVALLRAAPARAWAVYLAGAAPFAIGLIWFWLETTRSLLARQHLAYSSAIVAALFLWKQITEALFLVQLQSHLRDASENPLRPRTRWASLLLRQAAVQPLSLLLIPLAALVMFPAPQTLLFFRQFSLAAANSVGAAVPLSRGIEASRHGGGSLWALALVCAAGTLLLYFNLLALLLVGAQLASSVFGIQNLDLDAAALLRNTTVHASIGIAVYLAADLLFDAAAVLQEFRFVSQRSGEDILAALRRLATPAAAAIGLLFFLAATPPAMSQQPGSPPSAAELDRAIDRTLENPQYAWRSADSESEPPAFAKVILNGLRWVGDVVSDMVEAIARWLRPERNAQRDEPGRPGGASVQYWMIALAVVALVAAVLLIRTFARKQEDPIPVSAPTAPAVDLRDESVLATAFAEDEWLRLAERHLAEGEPRLALRALHLGCLRSLSERGLISISRTKTGADYLDEVRRRSRQHTPALSERFQQNVGLFEHGWYSHHPVELGMIEDYRQGLQAIRSYAAA